MSERDLEAMLGFLLEFAQMALREKGRFYPFGAGMTPDGEMTSLGHFAGADDPSPEELVSHLHSALVQQAAAGEIDTAGICTNVRIRPPGATEATDAICIELEHRSGEAIDVFVPYVFVSPGNASFGAQLSTPGEQVIFLPVAG